MTMSYSAKNITSNCHIPSQSMTMECHIPARNMTIGCNIDERNMTLSVSRSEYDCHIIRKNVKFVNLRHTEYFL